MNMNKTRLDDRFNGAAFAFIIAIVLSIGSAMVSLEVDSNASEPAAAQAMAPVQAVATTAIVAAR